MFKLIHDSSISRYCFGNTVYVIFSMKDNRQLAYLEILCVLPTYTLSGVRGNT